MIEQIRFRAGQEGLLVLQVLEVTPSEYEGYGRTDKRVWRDASTEDLLMVAKYTIVTDALTDQLAQVLSEAQSMRQSYEYLMSQQIPKP